MPPLKLLYRDVDRTPYLYALQFEAERHGLHTLDLGSEALIPA